MSWHIPENELAGTPYTITVTSPGASSGAHTVGVSGWPSGWTSFPKIVTAIRSGNVLAAFEATAYSGGNLSISGVYDGYSDAALQDGDTFELRPTKGAVSEIQSAVDTINTTLAGLGTAATKDTSYFDLAGAASSAQSAAESYADGVGTSAISTVEAWVTSQSYATTSSVTTSLAAYTGATNLVTVGTITAGTWQGTTVAIAHGGTGQTSASGAINALLPSQSGQSGNVLGTNGTAAAWQAPPASGITIGSTAISGGTAGRVLIESGSPVVISDTSSISWSSPTLTVSGNIVLSSLQCTGINFFSGGDINSFASNLRFYNGPTPIVMRSPFGVGTSGEISNTAIPFTVQAAPSQTRPLLALQAIDSTSAADNVGFVDAGFTTSTHASFVGYLRGAAQDWNATAGGVEGWRITTDGAGNPLLTLCSGSQFKGLLSATASLAFGTVNAGSQSTLTISVTGSTDASAVNIVPTSGTVESGIVLTGYVSTAGTVTVVASNVTGSNVTMATQTFRATCTIF